MEKYASEKRNDQKGKLNEPYIKQRWSLVLRIIKTHEMDPEDLPPWDRDQIYNGLDCCITLDVFDGLIPQIDAITSNTYNFSKALQAPTLEMKIRGVLVDQARKAAVIDEYYEIMERVEANLLRIVHEGVGMANFN